MTLCKCNLSALCRAGPIDPRVRQRREYPRSGDMSRSDRGRSPRQPSPGKNRNPLLHRQPGAQPRVLPAARGEKPAPHTPLCTAVCINQNKTRSQMQPVASGERKVFHPEPSETVLNNTLPLAISISARHRGPLHRKSRGKIIESIVIRKDCSFSPILVLTILWQG